MFRRIGMGQASTQSTFRNPSSTMAFLLTSQVQFIATLSLVDNTGAEDSALSGFANILRWVNLWPSESFSEGVASRIFPSEPDKIYGEDDGDDDGDDDTTKRGISVSFTHDLGSLLFMGNLALFAGLLVIIFSLHILVASAIEAHWLAKVRNGPTLSCREASRALGHGLSLGELSTALLDTRSQQPSLDRGSSAGRQSSDTVQSHSLRGPSTPFRGSSDSGDLESNEGEGGRTNARQRKSMGRVLECRQLSQSPWLHYPHLELIFLFFAFEGAVTSQVSALRSTSSSKLYYAALVTLVLYPVLMFAMVARTHRVRVRSDALIVFVSNENRVTWMGKKEFFSKLLAGSRKDFSLFAWADKGQWETVQTSDVNARRDADWFRIGFEPLFADFTQAGSWFILYTLMEFFSKLLAGSRKDFSLFAWADKGQWETVQTSDVNARRDADWFRIGFEPLFADFTQAGSWFILYTLMEASLTPNVAGTGSTSTVDEIQPVMTLTMSSVSPGWQVTKLRKDSLARSTKYTITFTGALTCRWGNFEVSLMKWAFFAIVGVLVDNSAVQLGLFCAMHSSTFILLVVFKPFANRQRHVSPVNFGFGLLTALIRAAPSLAFTALVVPLYLDTCVSLLGVVRSRRGRVKARENEDERAEREFIIRRTLRLWAPTWFRMVGNNLFACVRDTREGIRDPTGSRLQARLRAGRIGPYPEWNFKLHVPVAIDLPRRRSGASYWYEEHVDAKTEQFSSGRRSSGEGWPMENDLPLRRSRYSFNSRTSSASMDTSGEMAKSVKKDEHRSYGRQNQGDATEDDLPRRRFFHPSISGSVDNAIDKQAIQDHGVDTGAISEVQDRNHGRGRTPGGPTEEDLPRRRPGFALAPGVLVNRADNLHVVRSAPEHGECQTRKRGGLMEDSLPRRRSCLFSELGSSEGSIDDHGLPSVPEHDHGLEDAVDEIDARRGWERRRAGPIEDDLPHRRSGSSSTSGAASHDPDHPGVQAKHDYSKNTRPTGDERGDRRSVTQRWGEPVEDSLPRRRSVFSSASTASVDGSSERQKESVSTCENDLGSVVDENSRRGWGRVRRGPAEDNLPHRRSVFPSMWDSAKDSRGHGLRKWGEPVENDLPRRRSWFPSASTASSGSINDAGLPSRTDHGDGALLDADEDGLQHCRGRKWCGPIEDGLPQRRSISSFASTASVGNNNNTGPQPAPELGNSATSAVCEDGLKNGRRPKWGGLAQDDLPRRRPWFFSTSTSSTSSISDTGQPSASDNGNGGTSGVDESGLKHGRGNEWGAPVEDDLPRRRPIYFSRSKASRSNRNGIGPQSALEHGNGAMSTVAKDGLQLGRGRKSGRPVERDLPQLRSRFSPTSTASISSISDTGLQAPQSPQGHQNGVAPSIDEDDGLKDGRDRKWREPTEDDLPRRRLSLTSTVGYAVGFPDESGVQMGPEHDSGLSSVVDESDGRHGRGQQWTGSFQDDLPRRRCISSSQMEHVTDSIPASDRQGRYDHGDDGLGSVFGDNGCPSGLTGRRQGAVPGKLPHRQQNIGSVTCRLAGTFDEPVLPETHDHGVAPRAPSDEDRQRHPRTGVDLPKPRRHVWWSDMVEGGTLELWSETLPAEAGLLRETGGSPSSRTGDQSSVSEGPPAEERRQPFELAQSKVLDSSAPDSYTLCAIGAGSQASRVLADVGKGNNLVGGSRTWSLNRLTPVEIYLPHRKRSKFPVFEQLMDAGDVTGGRLMSQDGDDASRHKRNDNLNGEKDRSIDTFSNELRGTRKEDSTRRRFGPVPGHTRRPTESTVPRRRPSSFAVGHEAGGGCETPGFGGVGKDEEKYTGKVVDADEDVNKYTEPVRTSEGLGFFRIAWGLPRGRPVPLDLPWRSTGYSFDSSHVVDTAAEVPSPHD
ncbi:unnamed protein product [Ectocarpus sp. CCAP 1310/34]|nr:unnamed protein product [Ectocarpus sp. CCAP 1310/34]